MDAKIVRNTQFTIGAAVVYARHPTAEMLKPCGPCPNINEEADDLAKRATDLGITIGAHVTIEEMQFQPRTLLTVSIPDPQTADHPLLYIELPAACFDLAN